MADHQNHIAIIGMAGRFPGSADVRAFWENLAQGKESIRFYDRQELASCGVPSGLFERSDFIAAHGALDGIDCFDPQFFGYSAREATLIDPQQRIFLECAWSALEDSGYRPREHKGSVGVYGAVGANSYYETVLLPAMRSGALSGVDELRLSLASQPGYLATRVAYKMDLHGPALTILTACSSSLVTVHLACQALHNFECSLALAGGVSAAEQFGYIHSAGSINSADGHCRAFDNRASGTVGGSGVGIVVLKRLEDALRDRDHIYAVVRGTAINNDGARKSGFTAPSVQGQAEGIRMAIADAGVEPSTISMIECHGTATHLGDPIEVRALGKVYQKGTANSIAIGSVKTNIGHLEAAAGIAGLIKVALSLRKGQIPPSLHYESANPELELDKTPFFVNTRLRPWPILPFPRRASVSSFGLGGTNAHAILEEAPRSEESRASMRPHILVISAKSEDAIDRMCQSLERFLQATPETNVADLAYTLQVGREAFAYRRAIVCRQSSDILTALSPRTYGSRAARHNYIAARKVAFVFGGTGSPENAVGEQFYRTHDVFRKAFDSCAAITSRFSDIDLYAASFGPTISSDTRIVQPVIFAVCYALARLWISWGVRPDVVVGHSLGEYTAAVLAGMVSLDDALKVVIERARLLDLVVGRMVAVRLSPDGVKPYLGGQLSIAAVNSPRDCVVSGTAVEIEKLCVLLQADGVGIRSLSVSTAFHSPLAESVMPEFRRAVAGLRMTAPAIKIVSTVTGSQVSVSELKDPEYWSKHLLQPVLYGEGISTILRDGSYAVVEIGFGASLTSLSRRSPYFSPEHLAVSSLGHTGNETADIALLEAAGQLWVTGVDIDWSALHAGDMPKRIPLPTYQFERDRYWIDLRPLSERVSNAPPSRSECVDVDRSNNGKPLESTPTEREVRAVWADALETSSIGPDTDFFAAGGDSLLAVSVLSTLRRQLGVDLPNDVLLKAPTVAQLSLYIDQMIRNLGASVESRLPACLVSLAEASETAAPLFLVHAIGGTVYSYRELALAFGSSRTVYGIQDLWIEGSTDPDAQSVLGMARLYCEAVNAVYPKGPIAVGGSSFGGLVACEMARRFLDAGRVVEQVFLIDSPSPVHPRRIARGAVTAESSDLDDDDSGGSAEAVLRDRMLFVRQGVDDADMRAALVRVLNKNWKALAEYEPDRYPGRLVYFRAQDRSEMDLHPELAWIDLADGGVNVHVVPGDHETMMKPPHIGTLARRMQEYL